MRQTWRHGFNPPVIASGAKQSAQRSALSLGEGIPRLDCFAASRLAMTTLLVIVSGPRHCERAGGVAGVAYNPQRPVSGFQPGRTQSCVHPWTLGVRPPSQATLGHHAPHGFVPAEGVAEKPKALERGGDFQGYCIYFYMIE
ncbi:MAG: hypothetical protein LBT00_13535 [Spirochaetaceae bacterium]|nr:hypothetical protein [Spirochaetaceae bacterium]